MKRLLGIVAIVGLSSVVAGCTSGSEIRGVILISADTLRADSLEPYGAPASRTPFLSSLGSESVTFDWAVTPLPGTLPAHMTMFTGLLPTQHGAFPPDGVLSAEIPTLPELVRKAGIRTAGHTEGGYVHGGYGFARGFEQFDHSARRRETDIGRTFDRATRFLEGLLPTDRFFVFVHTYTVHDPYRPPRPYLRRAWPGQVPEGLPDLTGPALSELNRREIKLDAQQLDYLRAVYDAQASYLDDQLARFFGRLEALGLLDRTVVIFTSDHGEEFQEHGRLLHTQSYRETLQVPLMIRDPQGSKGKRVEVLVQLADILPTVLDFLGVPAPEGVVGQSLVPIVREAARLSERSIFVEGVADRTRGVVKRVAGEVWHLVQRRPHIEKGHIYFGDSFVFDELGVQTKLPIVALNEPRWLEILVDGRSAGRHRLGVGADGRIIEVKMPGSAPKHRVELVGEACDELTVAAKGACFQYQLVDLQQAQYELFRWSDEGRGLVDHSEQDSTPLRALIRELLDTRFEAKVAPEKSPLDEELRERLRALGYLQ